MRMSTFIPYEVKSSSNPILQFTDALGFKKIASFGPVSLFDGAFFFTITPDN